MPPDLSEKNFEATIEKVLTQTLPAPEPMHEVGAAPGGYRKRSPDDYSRSLCLDADLVLDFLYATQPKEWEKLKVQHGADVKARFLRRLSSEVAKRGTLDVLRQGVRDSGCKFQLAYFRPASGLNPDTQRLYQANQFSIIRQLHFSEKSEKSLDLALFLNGLPIFTAELKNPLTCQTVKDAIAQYKKDRDPKEPLFSFGRCLAHFAVDPDLVYVTTRLAGPGTWFLPFNRGKHGGAGNEPSAFDFATAYLWREVWSRDSVLDLIQNFLHVVEDEDDEGKKTGKRKLLFPRYHQLDAVRRLIAASRRQGTGNRYLIQHSAGSGKSNSIAWLAHQLASLHDAESQRVFDSIIVLTDRRVLDRQLQRTVRAFEQTLGLVENIDQTSKQLKQALEEGKTIIVSTLQKFPAMLDQIRRMEEEARRKGEGEGKQFQVYGKRFAVIIDEAHSSQSGETSKGWKTVLSVSNLEEAEQADVVAEKDDLEDKIVAEMKKRGRLPNVSLFAFTATPKPKTLELFGTKRPDGKFEPFSLYTMRQAIEEGFILDVLANYTSYKAYWSLLKKIKDDPRYDRTKAFTLLRSFVELHRATIDMKVAIMVEHFAEHGYHQIKISIPIARFSWYPGVRSITTPGGRSHEPLSEEIRVDVRSLVPSGAGGRRQQAAADQPVQHVLRGPQARTASRRGAVGGSRHERVPVQEFQAGFAVRPEDQGPVGTDRAGRDARHRKPRQTLPRRADQARPHHPGTGKRRDIHRCS
jgi:type I restriction enzyme R subunit